MRDIMDEHELKDFLTLLEEQGWQPMACDSSIAFYDNQVVCGTPSEMGDIVSEEESWPEFLLSAQPEFVVTVRGDSMKDAGIEAGDAVKVRAHVQVHDGDIVLTRIDGEFTLKTFCEDEDGQPWLVPENEKYEAFPLNESQRVDMAVVTEIIKRNPHSSYRSCMQKIRQAKQARVAPREISKEQILEAIAQVAPMVTTARQWYSVFRVLVDAQAWGVENYDGFCELVVEAVPEHKFLPTERELQRMAVDSFAKPVTKWREDKAPVTGKRYKQYLQIATSMARLLE
ncbi:MAG: hypothetical protein IJ699_08915 [Bacteroidaceae bacterium]|nr:hypothetical protein [Bacteroidaceae bacterium]